MTLDEPFISTTSLAEVIGIRYGNAHPFFVRVPPKLGLIPPKFIHNVNGGRMKMWTPRHLLSLLVYHEVERGHHVSVAIEAARAMYREPLPFIVVTPELALQFQRVESAVLFGKAVGEQGPWTLVKVGQLSSHPLLSDILDLTKDPHAHLLLDASPRGTAGG